MDFKFADYLDRYPPAIARENITDFFPWLPAKTLSHLESQGIGPVGAFYVGKKKLYPTVQLLGWLDSRIHRQKGKGSTDKASQNPTMGSSRRGRKTKKQEVLERRG